MRFSMKKMPLQNKYHSKRYQTQSSTLSQQGANERSSSNQNPTRKVNPTQVAVKANKLSATNQNYSTAAISNPKPNNLMCISAKRRRGGVAPPAE